MFDSTCRLALILGLTLTMDSNNVAPTTLLPEIAKYVERRIAEFDEIPPERKQQLQEVSNYVGSCLAAKKPVRLVFVCTHNSRRSHLAQIWMKVAADYFGIGSVTTYSGGTEATAFNPRAIVALRRCGFQITTPDATAQNPRYEVRYRESGPPEICFSKVYDHPSNPNSQFCAVMTCSQADEACPQVKGCDLRVAITYEDPKSADGTPAEATQYDERSRQIAREMVYLVARVKK